MKKKDVIITIKGLRAEEHVEMVTRGHLYCTDGAYSLSYDETQLTGLPGTTTTLHVEDGKLTLTRSGESNSIMVFDSRLSHVSCYDTAFGDMTIGVVSDDCNIDMAADQGEISATYTVCVNNTGYLTNGFRLNYRTCCRSSGEYRVLE